MMIPDGKKLIQRIGRNFRNWKDKLAKFFNDFSFLPIEMYFSKKI